VLHKRLQLHPEKQGSPRVIYIAGAALRVADIVRTLKDKKLLGNQAGDVAKLFARHIKLPEHVSYLQRTFVSAAAGTPGRVAKLIEESSTFTYSCSFPAHLDCRCSADQRSVIYHPRHHVPRRQKPQPFRDTRDQGRGAQGGTCEPACLESNQGGQDTDSLVLISINDNVQQRLEALGIGPKGELQRVRNENGFAKTTRTLVHLGTL